MVVAVIMALVVRMIRSHLFDGGRHLHGTQRRVSRGSSGLLSTHPPHPVNIFSMIPSGKDSQELNAHTLFVYLKLGATLVVGDVECG